MLSHGDYREYHEVVVSIFKNRERKNCEHYKALCLSSVSIEVYGIIVDGRLRNITKNKIGDAHRHSGQEDATTYFR